ncbi:MAG TPA: RNA polymerase sigma factor [Solirubrobacterales bacterium]|nr:RNA polymerase sigma factor [Solirubrobacterales bacterium]
MAQVSDDHLAQQATQGDKHAFEAIFQRYHRDLYRFCLAMVGNAQDAQDALQNTMVKVLRALPGEQRQINLKPWLYRIARNEAVETMRRRRESLELDSEQGAAGAGLAETAEHRERLRALLADLDELPERQRAGLVMRELAGLGFEQIGAAFETTPAVARQTVYEARLSLRQMEEGREMSCDLVMRELSDADGRVTRRREMRAHLRGCASCRAFRDSIGERRSELAAIAPLPAALSAAMLHGILSGKASAAGLSGSAASAAGGAAGGGAGAGAGGVAGTIGAGAGKAVATSAILKAVATVAVVATVGATAADRSGLIHVPLLGGAAKSSQALPAAPPASDSNQSAGAQNGTVSGGKPGAATARSPHGGGAQKGGAGAAAPGTNARQVGSGHVKSSNAQARGHSASSRGNGHGHQGIPAASSHGKSTSASHRAVRHATRHSVARHSSHRHASHRHKPHRRAHPAHSSHPAESKPPPPKPAPSKEGGGTTTPTSPPVPGEAAEGGTAGRPLSGVE